MGGGMPECSSLRQGMMGGGGEEEEDGGGVCIWRWRAGRNVGEEHDMERARSRASHTKFNKEV